MAKQNNKAQKAMMAAIAANERARALANAARRAEGLVAIGDAVSVEFIRGTVVGIAADGECQVRLETGAVRWFATAAVRTVEVQ